jgi:hypothetical protein
MNKLSVLIISACLLMFGSVTTDAQISSKVTNDKYDDYMDSLQSHDYPYPFPIFGNRVRDLGYDLPKPAGIMAGYIFQKQNTEINNLAVNFREGEDLQDISELVNFSKTESKVNVFTTRLDVWLFPFLNFFGIYNRIDVYTDVALDEPFELTVPQINNKGDGYGFGSTLAYGWGPVWASANANMVWTSTPVLTTPTQSLSSSFRVGTHLWNKKRTQHISVWVGANYLDYIGTNGGSYDMTQLLPEDGPLLEKLNEQLQEIIDMGNERYEEYCSDPRNSLTCNMLGQLIPEFKSRVEDKLSGLEPPALIINYEFNSAPSTNWNFLTGAQYTLHKRWDFRAEFGFGGRTSAMVNVNYRFGFFPKKGTVSVNSNQ